MKPRERAYLALLASLRDEGFITNTLENFQKHAPLSPLDYAFAYEIAAGSARMALALDAIAEKLSDKQKLSLKLKERALLRTAIYQHTFMDKVPLYAIANETMELAKKYCHPTFGKFVNALLRRLEAGTPALPSSDSPHDLAVRLSYPKGFVSSLLHDYGLDAAKAILAAGNLPPHMMVRIRPKCPQEQIESYGIAQVWENRLSVGELRDKLQYRPISSSPYFYIQNATPVALLDALAQKTALTPLSILDLCSSPGGKLLALHDLFPDAHLFANDVSEEKLIKLKANIAKYGLKADIRCGLGEEYTGTDKEQRFNLIVVDAPCSNSGVLNKRPEARWRIDTQSLNELRQTQLKLLTKAYELLQKDGEIWFMTCSILKEENEGVVEALCKTIPLKATWMQTILPNDNGWDGGFACLLKF